MQMIVYKATVSTPDKEEESRVEGGELEGGRWKQKNMSEVSQLID